MSSSLYRKVAIDRLSSPEQLDKMITLTKPRAWLGLGALSFLIVVVVLWSFLGEIPIKVTGSGILTTSGGIYSSATRFSGQVTDIRGKTGDYVKKGDILARLSQPELVSSINQLRREIDLMNVTSEKVNLDNPVLREQLRVYRENLKGQLEDAVRDLETKSTVVAQVEGRILEVRVKKGDFLTAGEPAFQIMAYSKTYNLAEVVLYVSPEEGKKILPGMNAQISPSITKVEDYGYILGKVTTISDYPATLESMKRILGNEELATKLGGSGAPMEVRISLLTDPNTISGFKWSTPKGAPIQLSSGNLCTGSVTIDRIKPIQLVLP